MARLYVFLQFILPRYWLTSIIYHLARIRQTTVKDFLISRFVRLYDVDITEIALDVPRDFATFNDFFIRELKASARPIDSTINALVSPVDGTVSLAGQLHSDTIMQAKGRDYTLNDLLATDLDDAQAYTDGSFATFYLAPHNYHRVHAPFAGELVAARYVPGDLFSVNTATAAMVRGLFRRNERLILHFATSHGPAVLIFVGALNVGSIATPWSGEIRPRKSGTVEVIDLSHFQTAVDRGDLLGWFNMGSTVIVLLPADTCAWRNDLVHGATVRMGEAIAELSSRTT
ncbi:MAG: phosphatidylserine decarboxylase [Proteobacteria bacterium]|nr:phosphatidylserine decarboxylase [Pseudomonadota bacterium]